MLDTDRSERAALAVSVGAMLVCALPLARVMGAAWEGGGLARELLQLRWLVGADITALSVSSLGFFLALLTLMTADPKKRVQGVLLWASVAVAMAGLASRGVFLRAGVGPGDLLAAAPWLLAGYLPGLLAGGGRRLLSDRTTDALEFRRASTGVFAVAAVLVVVGVLEYHLTYPLPVDVTRGGVALVPATASFGVETAGIVTNTLAAGAFLAVSHRFVRYDAGEAFLVLGPRGSGKSLLLLGAFLEARERSAARDDATPMHPTSDLLELADGAASESGWSVAATGQHELGELAFSYVHGSAFPTNVRLSTLDYAGELLPRVANALAAPAEQAATERLREDLAALDADAGGVGPGTFCAALLLALLAGGALGVALARPELLPGVTAALVEFVAAHV